MLGTLGSVLSTYSSIDRNFLDDSHFRDKRGRRYTASASYEMKTERVRNARADYSLFFLVKLIFKNCILRLFAHGGIFMASVSTMARWKLFLASSKQNDTIYEERRVIPHLGMHH